MIRPKYLLLILIITAIVFVSGCTNTYYGNLPNYVPTETELSAIEYSNFLGIEETQRYLNLPEKVNHAYAKSYIIRSDDIAYRSITFGLDECNSFNDAIDRYNHLKSIVVDEHERVNESLYVGEVIGDESYYKLLSNDTPFVVTFRKGKFIASIIMITDDITQYKLVELARLFENKIPSNP